MGAHLDGSGTRFTVWAPNARSVCVAGSFNGWHGEPMQRIDDGSGLWHGRVEGARAGDLYKYRIHGAHGGWTDKADPYAFRCEQPPGTASQIWDLSHAWGDREWMAQRGERQSHRAPDLDLRSAPGLVAARGGRPRPQLPRPGRAPGVALPHHGLHARRADAHRRASVLRLLGLPGHRLLRAHRALRHAAGPDGAGGHAAPARHRRAAGLGGVALPVGRARAGRTSTAPRCTSTPIRAWASIRSGTA